MVVFFIVIAIAILIAIMVSTSKSKESLISVNYTAPTKYSQTRTIKTQPLNGGKECGPVKQTCTLAMYSAGTGGGKVELKAKNTTGIALGVNRRW